MKGFRNKPRNKCKKTSERNERERLSEKIWTLVEKKQQAKGWRKVILYFVWLICLVLEALKEFILALMIVYLVDKYQKVLSAEGSDVYEFLCSVIMIPFLITQLSALRRKIVRKNRGIGRCKSTALKNHGSASFILPYMVSIVNFNLIYCRKDKGGPG